MRFGKPDDETGTRSIYGLVKISDAELLDRRAEVLARSVCPDDPRTHGERRTEALGIIAVNGEVLPCRCGKPDCPAAGKDPRAEHLVIHVITNDPDDQDGRDGQDGPEDDGPDDSGNPTTVVPTTARDPRALVPPTVVLTAVRDPTVLRTVTAPRTTVLTMMLDPTLLSQKAVARPARVRARRCRARPRR